MKIKNSREKFEEAFKEVWARRNVEFQRLVWLEEEQRYDRDHPQMMWELWQIQESLGD